MGRQRAATQEIQAQAGVEPGEQRLVRAQGESVLQLGQTDEDEAEQGAAVPFVESSSPSLLST